MTIVILNLSTGNLGSIPNMLGRLSRSAIVTSDPEVIQKASALVLPGVGAFDAAMSRVRESGLLPLLNEKVLNEKVPLLGICLGMQLLCESSEEGSLTGLGWIPSKVIRFHPQPGMRVPHMGWNTVALNPDVPLLEGFTEDPRFYFVHSYHLAHNADTEGMQTAFTVYGNPFPAIIKHENILGVQFHPEKSHRFGLQVFHNFLKFADTWNHKQSTAKEATPC